MVLQTDATFSEPRPFSQLVFVRVDIVVATSLLRLERYNLVLLAMLDELLHTLPVLLLLLLFVAHLNLLVQWHNLALPVVSLFNGPWLQWAFSCVDLLEHRSVQAVAKLDTAITALSDVSFDLDLLVEQACGAALLFAVNNLLHDLFHGRWPQTRCVSTLGSFLTGAQLVKELVAAVLLDASENLKLLIRLLALLSHQLETSFLHLQFCFLELDALHVTL